MSCGRQKKFHPIRVLSPLVECGQTTVYDNAIFMMSSVVRMYMCVCGNFFSSASRPRISPLGARPDDYLSIPLVVLNRRSIKGIRTVRQVSCFLAEATKYDNRCVCGLGGEAKCPVVLSFSRSPC